MFRETITASSANTAGLIFRSLYTNVQTPLGLVLKSMREEKLVRRNSRGGYIYMGGIYIGRGRGSTLCGLFSEEVMRMLRRG
jgi:hypothetical protein